MRIGGQLTIGAGITIHGGTGTVGYNGNIGGPANVSFINQGTINAPNLTNGTSNEFLDLGLVLPRQI